MFTMLYFVSGPVDMEFPYGNLEDWHLEAYNNSGAAIPVTFKVFDIDGENTVLIGNTSRTVNAHSHEYLTLSTNGIHHTVAQVEYPEGIAQVLLTLYGRNRSGEGMPGAIYFNSQLIPVSTGLG
jgi:hypothetical protein